MTCNSAALQRLALRTSGWFAVVTAGLAGNAVTNTMPGGSTAGAVVQFHMLTTAGLLAAGSSLVLRTPAVEPTVPGW